MELCLMCKRTNRTEFPYSTEFSEANDIEYYPKWLAIMDRRYVFNELNFRILFPNPQKVSKR